LIIELARSASASLAGACHTVGRLKRQALGQAQRLRSPDRRLLERHILPAFALDSAVRRALFVGCAPYTRHYPRLLPAAESWTLDSDPRRRRFGARHHVTAALQDLRAQEMGGPFDLIVCNGVLGWGLNSADDASRAMWACHDALRTGGCLLLGWNDYFPRNRVKPEQIPALAALEHIGYGDMEARIRVRSAVRHVFDLYRRP